MFNTSDYTYVTANSSFFDLLGKMLYSRLDYLLANDSFVIIEQKLASKSFGKPFVMDILTQDGVTCPMVCELEDVNSSERVLLRMTELEKMTCSYLSFETEHLKTEALLSQFDCVYFSYERAANILTVYRYDTEKEIMAVTTPEKWYEANQKDFTDESCESLLKFADNLKNGTRNFAGTLSKRDGNKHFRFMGTAIYNKDVHIMTVGTAGHTETKPIQDMIRRDQLTGLLLKEHITNYAHKLIDDNKKSAALAIVDIDNFKSVNDNFGHAVGDAVLKKCAAIISEQVAGSGKAGRIGGDEFFVEYDNYDGREMLRNLLRGIKNNILFAYSDEEDGFHVSASIGVSEYPTDADNFDTLFDLADHMLYRAKYKGKNRYIMYEREKHGTVTEVLQSGLKEIGLSGRRGLSKSETVCRIADLDLRGKECPVEDILNDVYKYFVIERVVLYNKTDRKIEYQCGAEPISPEVAEQTIDYLYDEDLRSFYADNVMVINNIKRIGTKSISLYDKIAAQGICSVMQYEITGNSGNVFVISYETTSFFDTWNMEDIYLYRLIGAIIKKRL